MLFQIIFWITLRGIVLLALRLKEYEVAGGLTWTALVLSFMQYFPTQFAFVFFPLLKLSVYTILFAVPLLLFAILFRAFVSNILAKIQDPTQRL